MCQILICEMILGIIPKCLTWSCASLQFFDSLSTSTFEKKDWTCEQVTLVVAVEKIGTIRSGYFISSSGQKSHRSEGSSAPNSIVLILSPQVLQFVSSSRSIMQLDEHDLMVFETLASISITIVLGKKQLTGSSGHTLHSWPSSVPSRK